MIDTVAEARTGPSGGTLAAIPHASTLLRQTADELGCSQRALGAAIWNNMRHREVDYHDADA